MYVSLSVRNIRYVLCSAGGLKQSEVSYSLVSRRRYEDRENDLLYICMT